MEQEFSDKLCTFIKEPHPRNAFSLITSSKPFILKHVKSWRNSNLSPSDKIKEIMSEMFLILLEDFDSTRINHPRGVISYLNLRLKRMTMPYRDSAYSFGLAGDFEDMGRMELTPFRLEMIREVVFAVRKTLVEAKAEVGLLEFMFIHIYPEIAWISRILAENYQEEYALRREKDKKRHQAFNSRLHSRLAQIDSGTWTEIKDWSAGERSHLAWRLIHLSQKELGSAKIENLELIENWRETISPKAPQKQDYLPVVEQSLSGLKEFYEPKLLEQTQLNEAAAPYGTPPDILSGLICPKFTSNNLARETGSEYFSVDADKGFELAASEVKSWLKSILAENKNRYFKRE
jgi:hypothetical protein